MRPGPPDPGQNPLAVELRCVPTPLPLPLQAEASRAGYVYTEGEKESASCCCCCCCCCCAVEGCRFARLRGMCCALRPRGTYRHPSQVGPSHLLVIVPCSSSRASRPTRRSRLHCALTLRPRCATTAPCSSTWVCVSSMRCACHAWSLTAARRPCYSRPPQFRLGNIFRAPGCVSVQTTTGAWSWCRPAPPARAMSTSATCPAQSATMMVRGCMPLSARLGRSRVWRGAVPFTCDGQL